MPGLVRRFLIFAAVDGLILQPHGNGGQRNSTAGRVGGGTPSSPIQIEYKTKRVYTVSPPSLSQKLKDLTPLESYGVIGLLSLASYSFLISITQRQQVAQILGKPIFVITGVAIIPLSSQTEATKAIEQARGSINPDLPQTNDDADSSDSEVELEEDSSAPDPEVYPPPKEEGWNDGTGVAGEVIGRRGLYGTFLTRWVSRKAWDKEKRHPRSPEERDPTDPAHFPERPTRGPRQRDDVLELGDWSEQMVKPDQADPADVVPPVPEEQRRTYVLLPKFLRFTKMMFASRSFYFSYDYDVTRRFGVVEAETSSIPLFRRADPLFFWNKHLTKPFVESGQHQFVIPVIQGFVGQQEFTAQRLPEPTNVVEGTPEQAPVETAEPPQEPGSSPDRNFLLTLISRRSVKRAGVRYLRRGVDDEGNTANSVETEQILSSPAWSSDSKVYSLLQLRGSIPLYFSQSPYYFKPLPVIHHSAKTNQIAFDRHFQDLGGRYGKVKVVCLVDKHGVEVGIGEEYGKYLQSCNEAGGINGSDIGFEWFDFHAECRGMKFENVQRLVDRMAATLEEFGSTVVQDSKVLATQAGIIRTNCMDCLDRTGVSQCAFGQWAIEQQLQQEGYTIDLRASTATQWFNILWADNGDAISKQYSSTAALKGDYTRTRRRNYRGALNDFGLTLSRYYNNIVTDYFSQACIDYLLGDVNSRVFDEFETTMESADPGISIEKIRQNAIDSSCKIVISDENEELIGGWIMLSPRQPNTLRSLPLEQSVLLLTDAAVYCCRFDWNTEKVISFERVDLRSITAIQYGEYITSTLTEAQLNPKRNVGLLITYQPGKETTMRVNTRSLQSERVLDQDSKQGSEWNLASYFKGSSTRSQTRFLAVKLPPHGTSASAQRRSTAAVSELETVRAICTDIERAAIGPKGAGHVESPSLIEEKEIISVADAKKQSSYLEHLVFDIKKLVWA